MIPSFSIIMPALNVVGVIDRALASAVPQLGAGDEIIVADGGSTDGTRQRVEETGLARLLPGSDGGIYQGMMRGIDAASGDYVLILNADDRLAEGAIDCFRAGIGRRPEIAMLTGRAVIEGAQSMEFEPAGELTAENALFAVPAINARVFRRDLFEQFRLDPADGIAADRAFLFRLALAGVHGRPVDKTVYRYLSHPGSQTIGADIHSRRRAIRADAVLAQRLVSDRAILPPKTSATVRAYAAVQTLRCARRGLAIPAQLAGQFPFLPRGLALWRKNRAKMAGW